MVSYICVVKETAGPWLDQLLFLMIDFVAYWFKFNTLILILTIMQTTGTVLANQGQEFNNAVRVCVRVRVCVF